VNLIFKPTQTTRYCKWGQHCSCKSRALSSHKCNSKNPNNSILPKNS